MRQSALPAAARVRLRPAVRLPRLAAVLLPLLVCGATACQSAPEGAALAPGAVPAVVVDDAAPGAGGAAVRTGVKDARVGEAVRVHGRQVGRHLEAVLSAYVDPAVSVEANFAPAAGNRWVAASMSFVNVGGASYGALGRMWAHDSAGRRHPVVPTGELTTGKSLVFDYLAVGERAEGWAVFEIPENARVERLQYEDANIRANSGGGFWVV
ncbi:hypothetical protein [Streptomyces subrutilus]|uniref:DUF4352 domain-containing protein n=1 Tax=Streptomyces subrutilus TaxID=36818 RepID=A0A1E5PS36_9ACTN|nr:hypothetical protein [Streptomyces subrutilus]OEJ32359.1 hypothetical protein BGK67_14370 [Streptomyces subrutilus]